MKTPDASHTMKARLQAAARAAALIACAGIASAGATPAADPAAARSSAIEHNNYGIAYLAQFKPTEAEKELRASLAAQPDYLPALVNLGIAQLAQVHYDEAIESFKRALLADPKNIYAHFNLSLIYKVQGKTDEGIREALSALAGDQRDADLHYNLASLYQSARDFDKAIKEYEAAIEIDSSLLPAYYALGRAYIAKGDMDKGRTFIKRHQELTAASSLPASSSGLKYGEQGRYSLAMEDPAARDASSGPLASGRVKFVDVTPDTGVAFKHAGGGDPRELRGALAAGSDADAMIRDKIAPVLGTGLAIADLDGDGREDLVLPNTLAGKPAVFTNAGNLAFKASPAGASIPTGASMGVAAADVDNDGDTDLAITRYGGVTLLLNDGKGAFSPAKLPAVPARYFASSVSLADLDHDGDVDIFVAGMLAAPNPPKPSLTFPADFGGEHVLVFQNNGNGTFTEIGGKTKLDDGIHRNVGAVFSDFDNDRDIDVAVARLGGGIALYTNNRDGTFSQIGAKAGLPQEGDFLGLCVGDYDRDGWMDIVATTWSSTLPRIFHNDGTGSFALDVGATANVPRGTAAPLYGCAFADIDNDGLTDILAVNGTDKGGALRVLRNMGKNGFEDAEKAVGMDVVAARRGRGLATGDLDGDGDLDLVITNNGTAPTILRNDGGNKSHWVAIDARGLHSNKLGVGTKVEVKAGLLWQKQEVVSNSGYLSSSATAPFFGLGDHAQVDALRLLWPGGVLQDEIKLASNKEHSVEELDRKGTSCPILYAWNGSSVAFVTDFLGGSAFGYLTGPGQYNYPDTEEYIRLPYGLLQPRDGRYEVFMNNQLEETIYFDRAQLVAVDHPAGTEAYPDEKLMPGPPFPRFRTLVVANQRPPRSAVDDAGTDQREALSAVDGSYVAGFRNLPFKGYAEPHTLEMDLGPLSPAGAVLLMTGWIDYADSTSNLAASQAGVHLATPSLQALDPVTGEWIDAMPEMGFPAGLPKTMTVDLTGHLPAGATKVRISTSMRIYWDRILVADPAGAEPSVLGLDPVSAVLRYRGFPKSIRPEGLGPPSYDYASEEPFVLWKAHEGAYTRFGDVRELLLSVDDLYVITRGGDEIKLAFEASALPPVPAGMTRTFFLHTDGFGKDMDLNSARPDLVGPLPYHDMPRFPYTAAEAYPLDDLRIRYLVEYNTRIVRRSVPPIGP